MKIDKVYLFLASVTAFTALCWASSCRHDTILPPGTRVICFEKEVLPIFQANCSMPNTGCHDGSGEMGSYNNYADISLGVVPGNPNSSAIYQAIIRKFGENKMPPNSPLSIESRTILRVWIEQGAAPTVCPDSPKPGPVPATMAPFNPPPAERIIQFPKLANKGHTK